jgi:hypothetical protein
MKQSWLWSVAALVGMTLAGTTNGFGADPAAPAKKAGKPAASAATDKAAPTTREAKKVAGAADATKEAAGRLPNHFAKLNLTKEQETQIRSAAQPKNRQIAQLRQQIAQLTEARDQELASFLNPEQKKQLAEAKKAAGDKPNNAQAVNDDKAAKADAGEKKADAPKKAKRARQKDKDKE